MPVAEKPKFSDVPVTKEFAESIEAMAAKALVRPPETAPADEKPLGVTVLIEDLHAVFVMARISMQPRAAPLRPSWTYAASFKRIRQALQNCGRIPT